MDSEGEEEILSEGEDETLDEAELWSMIVTRTVALLSALPNSPATRVRTSPTTYPVPLAETEAVATASMVPSKNSITEVVAAPARPTALTIVFLMGRNRLWVVEIGSDFAMVFVVKL